MAEVQELGCPQESLAYIRPAAIPSSLLNTGVGKFMRGKESVDNPITAFSSHGEEKLLETKLSG